MVSSDAEFRQAFEQERERLILSSAKMAVYVENTHSSIATRMASPDVWARSKRK